MALKPTQALVLALYAGACAGRAPPTTVTLPAPPSAAAKSYAAQCDADLAAAEAALAALAKVDGVKSVARVLDPLNDLHLIIDRALNGAQLYRNVHPDAAVRTAAERCEQEMEKIVTALSMARPIYDAVAAVDTTPEDAITKRYVKNLLRDFRRAGVDQDEATRQRIKLLREELVKVGQDFAKNMREDVRRVTLASAQELAGLPQDYIDAHQPDAAGKITITTDYPDYIPFMTYAKADAPRLALYREFRQRGYPANEPVLAALLAKRHELATLLGYTSWAHYVTEDKMMKTADQARSFIERISDVARARATRDYEELLAQWRQEAPAAAAVGDWQKAYVEEQLKREKYSFDTQSLRQYFPYPRVRQGILDLTARLFELTFKKVERPVWHPSVEAFEMYSGGALVGTFYLDMHPRDGKYKHAAAFPLRAGIAGGQTPEAALVCNFPGGDGAAGLLEHDDVETFFHEFGHLLHHMLGGRQRWATITGLNTEWDFVEAPSQMLEEWAWDGASLNTFARNAAGEAIPAETLKRMRRARDFGKGLWVSHQMFYAAVSLAYYDRDPRGLDTTALMRDLQAKYSQFKYVDDTYFQYSFGHLDGYSAIYCTYMWSLVIAKDLLSVFLAEGLLNPAVARRYRQKILERGGSADAEVLVREFLERPFSFDAFARWLNPT